MADRGMVVPEEKYRLLYAGRSDDVEQSTAVGGMREFGSCNVYHVRSTKGPLPLQDRRPGKRRTSIPRVRPPFLPACRRHAEERRAAARKKGGEEGS